MPIRPTRPAPRFQKGTIPARPANRPQSFPPRGAAPAHRPPAEVPPPEAVDVVPPLINAPDETDSGSVPVLENPPEAAPVPRPVPRPVQRTAAPASKNLQGIEALVAESKAALRERDAALEKAAALEGELAEARQRLEILTPLETRAGELQEQLAAVMAERDRNAEGLAEAQRQLEELQPLPAQVKELSEKLDVAMRARAKIAQEHAKLKSRLSTLEGQAKELIERLKASESGRRKAETALANAKEERNEYKFRLMSVRAVADGGDPPPRPKHSEEEKSEE
jgi:hypothetical protein